MNKWKLTEYLERGGYSQRSFAKGLGMSENAYYFSHDTNAKDDPKCVLLIEQLGLEGYGIFGVLIKTLRDQSEYKYPATLIPTLARRYNTTFEKIKTVVSQYGLFEITPEGDSFFPESLNRRMESLSIFRESQREKVLKRWSDFDVGLSIVVPCLKIIAMCRPQWWALENPVGHLMDYMGRAQLIFQPWEYGDPWTKRTGIWGRFNQLEKLYQNSNDVPDKLPLYTRPNRGKPNFAYLHKSAQKDIPQLAWAHPYTDADFRAITPLGFVQAFFKANK